MRADPYETAKKAGDSLSHFAAISVQRSRFYRMTTAAVMTAVTCVLAPLSIPIGPVPISLTNLTVYFALYLLGWKLGTLSYIVYLFLGIFGMPVFSGFAGGIGKLLGPTGGYLIGFVPMAIIGGFAVEHSSNRFIHLLGMALGTLVCYTFGTAWFCFKAQMAPLPALSVAVFPFFPGDVAKIFFAMISGPIIRMRLNQGCLLP